MSKFKDINIKRDEKRGFSVLAEILSNERGISIESAKRQIRRLKAKGLTLRQIAKTIKG